MTIKKAVIPAKAGIQEFYERIEGEFLMAVTEEFIEQTCKSCPHYNNIRSGVNRLVQIVAKKEIEAGGEVCGHCGCNLHRMAAAGKGCPIGKSGENRGLWRLLKGRGKVVAGKS